MLQCKTYTRKMTESNITSIYYLYLLLVIITILFIQILFVLWMSLCISLNIHFLMILL